MDRADVRLVEPATHAMVMEYAAATTKAENARRLTAAGCSALDAWG